MMPAGTPAVPCPDHRWLVDPLSARGGTCVPEATSVLLVEHRDEIAARLIADLQEFGLAVRRAAGATDAAECYWRRVPDLLITAAALPDESGWLVAAKFRLLFRDPPIWLYSPWRPPHNGAFAEFVGVDRCIYYGGDLWQLSEDVRGLLGSSPAGDATVTWTALSRSTPLPDGAIRQEARNRPLDVNTIH